MDISTISICTGYGGLELGVQAVVPRIRTVCYVEREISASLVLAARIKDGTLDDAPIWSDLKSFDATEWRGKVSLVTAGFPCQPHSVAGNRRGADDERELSGEILRIADELGRPDLFLENVPGIRRFYWDNIRPRLQDMGYRTEEAIVSAAETGAPHLRKRLFIMAHREREGHQGVTGDNDIQERTIRSDIKNNGNRVRCHPRWGNVQLADSERLSHRRGNTLQCGAEERVVQSYEQRGNKVGCQTKGRNSQLADTDRDRAVRNQFQHWEGRGIEQDDEELADGNSLRTQVSIKRKQPTEQQPRDPIPVSIPLYPPGPSDTRGWEHVFSQMPTLVPTFCRVVNGATPLVGRSIRLYGNGVVPAVAARAWQILSRRFLN